MKAPVTPSEPLLRSIIAEKYGGLDFGGVSVSVRTMEILRDMPELGV